MTWFSAWRACLLFPVVLGTGWSASNPVEFNRDIRPILSDKCFTCHGHDANNRKTKLRFDTEAGTKIPLNGGRVTIVPGDSAKSELFRRISSDDNAVRMPPAYAGSEKLSEREIDLIRRWIDSGAQWQTHWSFIPPKRPEVPAIVDQAWARTPIDKFILQRLQREGLQHSPEADRPTLIRRVSLDLTGLPPTPEEVDVFLRDPAPNAYEKVVDRLLRSPAYAERMAYRWMEAARYGDTNGYQTDGARDMWRWRDWVIDAFRQNMPFNQFTIEQIAGDLLPQPTVGQRIATAFHRNHRSNAEGGIVPEEFRVEYVADRAETTSMVWLGLTMGCARCHDHKYDPMKQKDFYRLFAFFNNVPEKGLVYNFGNEEPYIKAPTPEQETQLKKWDEKVNESERKWKGLQPSIEKDQAQWEKTVATNGAADWTITDGLVFHGMEGTATGCEKGVPNCDVPPINGPAGGARHFDGKRFLEAPGEPANFDYLEPFTLAAWIKSETPNGAIFSHSDDYLEGTGHGLYLMNGKLRLHVVFRWTDIGLRMETANALKLHEWQHVMVTYDGKRKASGVRMYIDGQLQNTNVLFDELTWPMKNKSPIRIGAGGGLRFNGDIADVRVYKVALTPQQASTVPVLESISQIVRLPAIKRSEAQTAKLRFCFLEKHAPVEIKQARQELAKVSEERDGFYETISTVMVMSENPEPRDTFVLRRGAYDSHGEKVLPGVPEVLPAMRPEWPNNRLGLARWLVDRNHPLTARVTVNRFWQMYFGTGIVKTVEDFGSQGEAPVHPELLDWLATEFMDSGWDVRHLQKLIVMSGIYRQSSRVTPELLQKDPDNRLLARGPRLRLGPEVIRDQALAASGLLVQKIGGPSVKPNQPPGLWQELAGGKGYVPDKGEGLYRRSLYTYWKRTVAPPFMMNFDSPSRETCTVRETRTNTPLQALNLMNDEMFLEASRKLAERTLHESGTSPQQRIEFLYRVVLGRAPKPAETRIVSEALQGYLARYQADEKNASNLLTYGESARDSRLNAGELAAYSTVASLILNLDEAVTKQ